MGSVPWLQYPGTSMILPILLLAAGVLTTPVTNIEDKNEAVLNVNDRAGTMTSKVKQTIKVKKKKFKCTITLVHDNRRVNLAESELECTPGKPKKQKAKNVMVDVAINPTSITKASILEAPATTTESTAPPTTTPMETSTSFPFLGTTIPGAGGDCTCGQANRGTRIVNGEETEVNEYPWMTGLVSSGGDRVWCGATLISSEWAMTAAHCTEGDDPENIEVLLGEHDYL